MGRRLEGVRSIAVLRAGGLGDGLLALPALAALRAAYPEAQLTLLGGPWHEVFRSRTAVADTLGVPVVPGVHDWPPSLREDPAATAEFLADAGARRFDLAVQLHHGSPTANAFLLRLGAGTTVGLRQPGAPALDRWCPSPVFHHDTLRALEAVALVGAAPVALEPVLIPTPDDDAEAAAAVDGAPVVLHPGGTDPRKRWPSERFAALADALADTGHPCLVVGTETDVVAEVRSAARRPLAAAPPLSLGGLAALLRRAPLVVGNDSGVRHLAGAVGTATVGLYFATNALNCGPLTRTRHRVLLSWNLSCSVCAAPIVGPACGHDHSWLGDVPLDDVRASCLDLLDRP